jgi:hypothetical protein
VWLCSAGNEKKELVRISITDNFYCCLSSRENDPKSKLHGIGELAGVACTQKIKEERGVKGIIWMHVTQFMSFSNTVGKGFRKFFLICCSFAALWFCGKMFSVRLYL